MRAILVSFLLHIKVDMIDCVIVLVNRGGNQYPFSGEEPAKGSDEPQQG